MIRHAVGATAFAACAAAAACADSGPASGSIASARINTPGVGSNAPIVAGVSIAVTRPGPPGEWPMPGGDYSNSRYSELDQITPANAKQLRVSWALSTGVLRGHEGQPLVVDNTMYVVTPFPNVGYAIDLKTEGQPLIWKFRPENNQQAAGRASAHERAYRRCLSVAVPTATTPADGGDIWATGGADKRSKFGMPVCAGSWSILTRVPGRSGACRHAPARSVYRRVRRRQRSAFPPCGRTGRDGPMPPPTNRRADGKSCPHP